MSLRLSGGRRLQSPPGQTARPTPARVRQAVINMLAPELPGCRWLDLCSGSGSMACEALQRGAAAVVAIEQDRRIAVVARRNLEAVLAGLGPRRQPPAQDAPQRLEGECDPAGATSEAGATASVHCSEVLRWLRRGATAGRDSERGFDLIYADPPYAAGLYGALAEAVRAGQWLRPEGTLLLECGSAQLPELPEGWIERDRRRYGTTTVLRLQLPVSTDGPPEPDRAEPRHQRGQPRLQTASTVKADQPDKG